jgi:uncharacterized protein YfiM (DUF2279 family)
MRFLLKVLFAFGLAIPLAAAATLYLAINKEPVVRRSAEITPANARRAKETLEKISLRRWQTNASQSVTISEQDLDLVANYLAYFYANGSARLLLWNDKAELTASLRPPRIPVIFYFNVTAVLIEGLPTPRFAHLSVGRVLIPGAIADWLARNLLRQLFGKDVIDAAAQSIKQVDAKSGQLTIFLNQPANLREKLQSALLAADQERLRAYQERLALISTGSKTKSVALTDLLVALFELAAVRAKQENPAAENRAAILVLAFHVNGKSLGAILPAASGWPRPSEQSVTLNGRADFAKHFIVSAALAANAGGPLADAVGFHKEIDDSRAGSGFSFTDIAANRAGTRFGAYAADNATATQLQQRIAAGIAENEIMPTGENLPELMTEAEFKRRFGGVGAPTYNRMIGEIDRRIAALRLYR